jgi:hypothetical protein
LSEVVFIGALFVNIAYIVILIGLDVQFSQPIHALTLAYAFAVPVCLCLYLFPLPSPFPLPLPFPFACLFACAFYIAFNSTPSPLP